MVCVTERIGDAYPGDEDIAVSLGAMVEWRNVSDKPSINGVVLEGNKTTKELGIKSVAEATLVDLPEDYTPDTLRQVVNAINACLRASMACAAVAACALFAPCAAWAEEEATPSRVTVREFGDMTSMNKQFKALSNLTSVVTAVDLEGLAETDAVDKAIAAEAERAKAAETNLAAQVSAVSSALSEETTARQQGDAANASAIAAASKSATNYTDKVAADKRDKTDLAVYSDVNYVKWYITEMGGKTTYVEMDGDIVTFWCYDVVLYEGQEHPNKIIIDTFYDEAGKVSEIRVNNYAWCDPALHGTQADAFYQEINTALPANVLEYINLYHSPFTATVWYYDENGQEAQSTVTFDVYFTGRTHTAKTDTLAAMGDVKSAAVSATNYTDKAISGYKETDPTFKAWTKSASIAVGRGAKVGVYNSTAIGSSSTASGSYSTAIGSSSTASGSCSTAIGFKTEAHASEAVAMGNGNIASNKCAVAIGLDNHAFGEKSAALGSYAYTAPAWSYSLAFSQLPSLIYLGSSTTNSGATARTLASYLDERTPRYALAAPDTATNTIAAADGVLYSVTADADGVSVTLPAAATYAQDFIVRLAPADTNGTCLAAIAASDATAWQFDYPTGTNAVFGTIPAPTYFTFTQTAANRWSVFTYAATKEEE